MSESLLSVVIVNWNAKEYIAGCLKYVLNSNYPHFEVILVDNHSEDGSINVLRDALSKDELNRIDFILNDKNYGAAYALNQGAERAKGKYITFLATDTKVEKKCFFELIKVFETDDAIGAVSSKLLMMNDHVRIDSAGEYLSQYGILIQRHAGQEIDRGQFDSMVDIFSAKGTALTVRKKVFDGAGGFPEDYFMFLEETDLCWRVWLSGYRIVFVPQARIYHACGVSINKSPKRNYLVKYYGTRNYIYTLLKNLSLKNILAIVSVCVLMWLSLAVYLGMRGRVKEARYVALGILWNIVHINKIRETRRMIQKRTVVTDGMLFPKIMQRIPISYLYDRVRTW